MKFVCAPASLRRALPVVVFALVAVGLTTCAFADQAKVDGVTNFGRVTDTFLRGGKVTSDGLENLHEMGVKTVVDLAGKKGDERETAERLGMTFYSFPMKGKERPDDATVERILTIIRTAKEPVYVHCSAGKHRVGTITALYRMRVQGWSPEKTWAEQESYGFGPPSKHPALYEYVYGHAPDGEGGKADGKKHRSKHDDDD